MDPLDALVVKYVQAHVPYGGFTDAQTLAIDLNSDPEKIMTSLSNLSRLGCFDYSDETGGSYITTESTSQPSPVVQFPGHFFRLTPLAEALLRACAVSR